MKKSWFESKRTLSCRQALFVSWISNHTIYIHTPHHASSKSLISRHITHTSSTCQFFLMLWWWTFYLWNVEMYGKLSVGGVVRAFIREDCSDMGLS